MNINEIFHIYIGTSGWSYLQGRGYLERIFLPFRQDELEYYSQFLNTVEVSSSFYRSPNPGFAENWVKRMPKDFFFAIQLWQKFTHPRMYQEATGEHAIISQNDVDMFISSIEPIYLTGKLCALLTQFPPSFKNGSYGHFSGSNSHL